MIHPLCQLESMALKDFLSLLTGISGFGVLALFTWAWNRGLIITKRELDRCDVRLEQMRAERDEWKNAALRSLANTERLSGVAQRAAEVNEQAVVVAGAAINQRGSQP